MLLDCYMSDLLMVGNKKDDLILKLRFFHKDHCAKRFGVV